MVRGTECSSITFRSDGAISIDRKESVIQTPKITARQCPNPSSRIEEYHYYPEKDLYEKIYEMLQILKTLFYRKKIEKK
jgi:hypothetical protein